MTHEEFAVIFDHRVDMCRTVLIQKAQEYATEDRLHNFKVAAELRGCSTKEALSGMLVKHIVSIFDMCETDYTFSQEAWDEKIGDALNYLFLLDAILKEL